MVKSESKSSSAAAMIKKTAVNKTKRIAKALKTAGGRTIQKLNERLKFWENKR